MLKKAFILPVRATDYLLERCLVIAGALTGAQIPGFISHYRQRLGGRLDEAQANMQDWQAIAARTYDGQLDRLIADHLANANPALVEVGQKIAADQARYSELQTAYTALTSAEPLARPLALLRYWDTELAARTLDDYVLNLPTSLEGIVYAGLGAVLLGGLYRLAVTGSARCLRWRPSNRV